MRRGSRAPLLLAGGVSLVVACTEFYSTGNLQIASLSSVLLPSPSVVVGDSMRDADGKVAPLRVDAFGPNGEPLTDVDVQFVVTDTSGALEVNSAAIALGIKQSNTATLVGQVSRSGAQSQLLQTNQVTVPVTVAPDTLTQTVTSDTILFRLPSDSLAPGLVVPLAVTVKGGAANDVPAVGFIVRYTIDQAPPSDPGNPEVVLVSTTGKPSTADTTDNAGLASLNLRLRISGIANTAVLAGNATDTVKVSASLSYKGQPVAGSPARFAVYIQLQR
jgi:hypothetical protein